MAHTLAKENLTRLFYSSLQYRPVRHLLALLIVTPFFLIRATEWDKIYHGQLRAQEQGTESRAMKTVALNDPYFDFRL